MAEIKYLNSAGLTAYDTNIKEWFKSIAVDITDDAINALFVNPLEVPYVTFKAEEAGSTIGLRYSSPYQTLEYSTDTTNWNTMDTTISLTNVGDKVYIRGILSGRNSGSNYTRFVMTGKIAASGNCNAIWNYQDLEAPLKVYCGHRMFQDCTSLTTAPALPSNKLANYCYYSMFDGCTSLTTAPELPAKTLAEGCYQFMFSDCTSLITAPELPASTFVKQCYNSMFLRCTSLSSITCYATYKSTTTNCTYNWVSGVASTGTFTKAAEMGWSVGTSGIPKGWTVVNIIEPEVPEDPVDITLPYVTFKAKEDNGSIGLEKLSPYQTLEYSTDTTNWNTMDTTTSIPLTNVEDKVYIRGILSADNTKYDYTQFKMTGKIAASGNCNAIWNYQDLEAPLKVYCGKRMFQDCTSLTTAPALPSNKLADYCYESMFEKCTSLTAAELPATTLASWCYSRIFLNCYSLTTAPELPATTLAYRCYSQMFSGCISLTSIPELPATTLADSCYYGMFGDCISLTTAPELPAITLATSCYSGMFSGCKYLTTAPELPVTTLADSCYSGMFSDCISLTTAPELPATTLADRCYREMFSGCSKLNYIKCLATDISAFNCKSYWVDGVASNGTFTKAASMTSWTTGVHGIPEGWTVVDAEL